MAKFAIHDLSLFARDSADCRAGIVDGLARMLWALQWVQYERSQGRVYPTQKLEATAPDTPEEAYEAAIDLIQQIEERALQRGQVEDPELAIVELFIATAESLDDTPERFGVALACMNQGVGDALGCELRCDLPVEVPIGGVDLEAQVADADTPDSPSELVVDGPEFALHSTELEGESPVRWVTVADTFVRQSICLLREKDGVSSATQGHVSPLFHVSQVSDDR